MIKETSTLNAHSEDKVCRIRETQLGTQARAKSLARRFLNRPRDISELLLPLYQNESQCETI